MLVLSRKKGERIMIGDDISVMVVAIQGDKVRIGIEAPRSVDVHREEVYEKIHAGSPPSKLDAPSSGVGSDGATEDVAGRCLQVGGE